MCPAVAVLLEASVNAPDAAQEAGATFAAGSKTSDKSGSTSSKQRATGSSNDKRSDSSSRSNKIANTGAPLDATKQQQALTAFLHLAGRMLITLPGAAVPASGKAEGSSGDESSAAATNNLACCSSAGGAFRPAHDCAAAVQLLAACIQGLRQVCRVCLRILPSCC